MITNCDCGLTGGCHKCQNQNQFARLNPIHPPGPCFSPPSQGWECPRCHAVMAPTMMNCVNCRGSTAHIVADKIQE